MNPSLARSSGHADYSAIAFVIGFSVLMLAGCVVAGGGYGYDNGVEVGVGLGYYEPYGSYYGGWGPGYRVGPPGGNYHPNRGGGRPTPHAYRSPPVSHAAPSIPSGRRGSKPH
jgi:hypothetical protein